MYFLLLPCFVEISEFSANRVDSDQTPRSVAFNLGLHCLSISIYWMLGLNRLICEIQRKFFP